LDGLVNHLDTLGKTFDIRGDEFYRFAMMFDQKE